MPGSKRSVYVSAATGSDPTSKKPMIIKTHNTFFMRIPSLGTMGFLSKNLDVFKQAPQVVVGRLNTILRFLILSKSYGVKKGKY
jgi:hypothetical protein